MENHHFVTINNKICNNFFRDNGFVEIKNNTLKENTYLLIWLKHLVIKLLEIENVKYKSKAGLAGRKN